MSTTSDSRIRPKISGPGGVGQVALGDDLHEAGPCQRRTRPARTSVDAQRRHGRRLAADEAAHRQLRLGQGEQGEEQEDAGEADVDPTPEVDVEVVDVVRFVRERERAPVLQDAEHDAAGERQGQAAQLPEHGGAVGVHDEERERDRFEVRPRRHEDAGDDRQLHAEDPRDAGDRRRAGAVERREGGVVDHGAHGRAGPAAEEQDAQPDGDADGDEDLQDVVPRDRGRADVDRAVEDRREVVGLGLLERVLRDADAEHREGDREDDRRADVGVTEAAEHQLEDQADQRADDAQDDQRRRSASARRSSP